MNNLEIEILKVRIIDFMGEVNSLKRGFNPSIVNFLNINKIDSINDKYLIQNEIPLKGIQGFKNIKYYSHYKKNDCSIELQSNRLTHLIYTFIVPDTNTKDGSLFPIENLSKLQKIVDKAKYNGIKTLISLGGSKYNGVVLGPIFSKICATKKGREKLVSNTMILIKQHQLDGVDINWKHPQNGNDNNNFTELILEFNRRLKPQSKLLTLTIQSGVLSSKLKTWVPNWNSQAITNKTIEYVDWLNLMTHNNNNKTIYSQRSLDSASLNYWSNIRGIKKIKLIVGAPNE